MYRVPVDKYVLMMYNFINIINCCYVIHESEE